jgi:hypothetical protein
MGTRNLTLVQQNGQYKVAQYGQFDGYPAGQGKTVLEFLRTWDRPAFERKVAAASFMTESDIDAINEQIKAQGLRDTWTQKWPELSREPAAKILQIIADRPDGIRLKNTLGFAGDSLMCEWAYVIDLDAGKLEVLKGFNQTPLVEGDRFFAVLDLEKSSNTAYHAVRKVAVYDLESPPTLKQMQEDCEGQEDES